MKARRFPNRISPVGGSTAAETLATTARRSAEGRGDAVERGLRTAAAIAETPDEWQWPRWLDRQLRPNHPAFVAAGDASVIENLTGRDWRQVGTVSSGCLATVDSRGSVAPPEGGWSLDWLVGAEDRWHRPAHEAGVRQRLVAAAPVVETICRVPGGDITQRVYGVTLGHGRGDALVIEVENQTAVPVALAFAVRPVDVLGAGSIVDIALDDTNVLVDGRPVLVFDRAPSGSVSGDAHHDSLSVVVANEAPSEPFAAMRDQLGLANAAFVFPLPHRTSLRVLMIANLDRRERASFVDGLPSAEAVGNGWSTHADRAAVIELPDERLNRFWAEGVRNLILAAGDGSISRPVGRRGSWRVADEARIIHALQIAGLHDTAGAALRRRGDEFELDGWFRRETPSLERNAAIFGAVGEAWSLARDRDTVEAVLGPAVKAAHWSERHRSRNAERISAAEAYEGHDSLVDLASALRGVDQPDAAQDVAAFAARFVLDHDEPTLHLDEWGSDPLVTTRWGIDSLATVERATALIEAGDEAGFASVAWLAEASADRGRWPSYLHPRLGTGCAGAGDDPVVAAAIVEFVRSMAVRVESSTLAVLPVVPDTWLGQSIDVRELPTVFGRFSFAIRWHGARPALLWELHHEGDIADVPAVTITVPGLDPTFSSNERAGEALLAEPRRADVDVSEPAEVADPGASFS